MGRDMICLKNGKYLAENGEIKRGSIFIENDRIVSIGETNMEEHLCRTFDIENKIVIPGFIDIHFHGAIGLDLMYAKPEEIIKISKYLAKTGTTSYLATTITSSNEDLEDAVENITTASHQIVGGAAIEGIHIEGPYISPLKKGCHEPKFMRAPENRDYDNLKRIVNPLKLHFTVAPEIEKVLDFIDYVNSKGDTISIGHSDADSLLVKNALRAGATSFTHLFNAMKGINHREPGVAGTALLSNAFVELICDGVHVNPEIMNIVYRLKGKDQIILVTDAMQAAGLGDGDFVFGGSKVCVQDGIARNEDGTLASSTLTMLDAVRNMMKLTDVSFAEAIQMATLNPAKLLGLDRVLGSIAEGKRADILVIDEMINLEMVFCRGIRVK